MQDAVRARAGMPAMISAFVCVCVWKPEAMCVGFYAHTRAAQAVWFREHEGFLGHTCQRCRQRAQWRRAARPAACRSGWSTQRAQSTCLHAQRAPSERESGRRGRGAERVRIEREDRGAEAEVGGRGEEDLQIWRRRAPLTRRAAGAGAR